MTSQAEQQVIWVKRADAASVSEAALRERAGVDDPHIEVLVEALEKFGAATIRQDLAMSGARRFLGS